MSEAAAVIPAQTADDAGAAPTDNAGAAPAATPESTQPTGNEPAGVTNPEGGTPAEGTPGAGDGDGKTGDEPAVAPDAYADFTLPEGVTMDAELLEQATPLFKETNLTQEQAQKYVDLFAGVVQAREQAQADGFNQLVNDWDQASVKDSEFGGDDYEKNVNIAASALNKFGTPALTKLLDENGTANHPEVVRLLWKVGKHLIEDNPGNGGNSGDESAKDRVSIMYPNG